MNIENLKLKVKEYAKTNRLNRMDFLLYLLFVKNGNVETIKKSFHKKNNEKFGYSNLTNTLLELSKEIIRKDTPLTCFIDEHFKEKKDFSGKRQFVSLIRKRINPLLDDMLSHYLNYQIERVNRLSPYDDKYLIKFLYDKKLKKVSKLSENESLAVFKRTLSISRMFLKRRSVLKTLEKDLSNRRDYGNGLDFISYKMPILRNNGKLKAKMNEEIMRNEYIQDYMSIKPIYAKDKIPLTYMWGAGLMNMTVWIKKDGKLEKKNANLQKLINLSHFSRVFQEERYGISANVIIEQLLKNYIFERGYNNE